MAWQNRFLKPDLQAKAGILKGELRDSYEDCCVFLKVFSSQNKNSYISTHKRLRFFLFIN